MIGNPHRTGGRRIACPIVVLLAFAGGVRAQVPVDLERAVALEQSGKPDQAIALLRSLLKRDPQSADAHNWLGVAYLQKNQLTEAAAEFREAVKLKPDYVRAYNNLGSTLAQGGDYAKGIQALETGLKYAPADLQLRINLGMALRSKGDAEGAMQQFQSLLREHADSPELQYQYGQTLRQKGELAPAIDAFEKALALNAEVQEVYYALAQALKELAAKNRTKPWGGAQPPQLQAARQAIARGDAQAAREALEAAVRAQPESAEAHNLLGFFLGRSGDLPAGIAHLRKAVELDADLSDAHYNLGVALWFQNDRAGAAQELDDAIRLNPAAGNAYGFRGMVYREAGDLDHARQMLQRALALDPKAAAPYFDLGVVFLRMHQVPAAVGQFEAGLNLPRQAVPDLEAAIAELRRALGETPNAEGSYALGRMLGLAGADASQVIGAFEQAIRLQPDSPEAENALGLVYVQTGDDEKAAAAFRQAIKLRVDWAEPHQNLGAVLTTSDAAEAVRELEKAVSLEPRMMKAQYNLAEAYAASSAHGPAKEIEQLKKVLATEPKYPRAEFAMGRALLRSGKIADAVAHLQTAVAQEPDSGETHYQLGLALSRAGRNAEGTAEIQKGRELIAAGERQQNAALDLAEAKAALEHGDAESAIAKARRIVAAKPDAAEPYYVLGQGLAKKGDQAGAASALRKSLAIDPGNSGAQKALEELDDAQAVRQCEDLIRAGRFQEADPVLRAYTAAHPQSAWGWYAMGYSLYGQQKVGDSIRALARSLELNSASADAHKVLGRALMMIGRFDAAKVEFEQGARLDPKSAEMPYNLGKLFSIQDNWADARKQFEHALQLDPKYMEAYEGLGLAMEALGEDEAAKTNYAKAIELNEANQSHFSSAYVNLSALYNRNGHIELALENARKALDANPKSDRALFQMAKAYESRAEWQAAADALNRAIAINARSSSYFYVLATVYRKLGKPEESRKAMATFAQLDRESNELDQKRREGSRQRQ